MKPFHTIAVPHRDILEGRLTMDIFAADLWETYMKRAPSEYRDAELFFKKTYLTNGLKNLLDVVEKRLNGQGRRPRHTDPDTVWWREDAHPNCIIS